MVTIVKHTREVGTSAGVLLPRSWLNKQVVVTLFRPSTEEITKDVLDILLAKNLNEEIMGVYLFGSYARGDYDAESDIDVLVITRKINKLISYGNYEITLVSEKNLSKYLSSLYYLSAIRETKILINRQLIEKYLLIRQRLNIKTILKEIQGIIRINRDIVGLLEKNNENVPDGIVYSIVLRLRELYLIKCLISNKPYNKRNFLGIISEKAYSAYSRVKRDKEEVNDILPSEAMNLLDLSERWLKELKELKKEPKV